MKKGPVRKPVKGAGYPFPLPLDCADIFQIGPGYTERWFRASVTVPTGVWVWVESEHLRPFVNRLGGFLAISGKGDGSVAVKGDRYVVGCGQRHPPVLSAVPTCAPISLNSALGGLAKRVRGNEGEVLEWLEFFQSHAPAQFATSVRQHSRLVDLMR